MQWFDWTYLTRANSVGEPTVKEEWRDALSALQHRLRELVEVSAKDLIFDGVTDQTAELQNALDTYGGVRVLSPPGGVLRLEGTIEVRSGQVLDLSACATSRLGEIVVRGSRSGAVFLASSDWLAGATSLPVSSDPTAALAPGDIVEISDNDSVLGEPVRVELARVEAVTATVVTLNRPLLRSYTVARGAQLEKIVAAAGALVVGSRREAAGGSYGMELAYESAIIGAAHSGLSSGARLLRVERSLNCLVGFPVALGDGGTGALIRASTGVVVAQPRMEGLDRGIEVRVGSLVLTVGGLFLGCTTGLDTRGTECRSVSIHGALFHGCDTGVRVGSTDYGRPDEEVTVLGCQFQRCASAGAEVWTPSRTVTVSGSVATGSDLLRLEGTSGGGEVFLPSGTQAEAPGAYALRDNTTAGGFSKAHIGTILQDGTVAGLVGGAGSTPIAQDVPGLPSPASLPGGVLRSDGSAYYLADPTIGVSGSAVSISVDTTLDVSNAWLVGAPLGLQLTSVLVDSGASPVRLSISASAPPGTVWRLFTGPGQSGTVTLAAPAGKTFQDGSASTTLLPGPGRYARVEVLPDGNLLAEGEVAAGIVLPKNTSFGGGDVAFGGAAVADLRPSEITISANYTLAASDAGKVLFVTTAGVAVTVPASWVGRAEVRNSVASGGNISINGVGTSPVTVAPGQSALVVGYAGGEKAVFVIQPTANG